MSTMTKSHSFLDPQHAIHPKAPGHWLLARLGKRVLRPGGIEATHALLNGVAITPNDRVIEFAPGMGITARRIVALRPSSYTAIERDETAASRLRGILHGPSIKVVNTSVEQNELPSASADVVIGEAMLTMQSPERKRAIIAEAARLLRPGGRYGIHEIALRPEGISEAERRRVYAGMSKAIHHGVMPQTIGEWHAMLAQAGFTGLRVELVPFRLLEPGRILADEGLLGAARFAFNMLRMPAARRQVLAMRRAFQQHIENLTAIVLVAEKQS